MHGTIANRYPGLWGLFLVWGVGVGVWGDLSPTSICTRWSQQSALVGSLLYIYGGRSTSSSSQTSNTWNNYFITLDLSKSFNISSPPLTGLPLASLPPSGPPAISMGALWASSDGDYLYQFAGEFSDDPATAPSVDIMWRYDISGQSWSTVSPGGTSVTRPAEGASCMVPTQGTNGKGLAVYLGGHLDAFSVAGWSIDVAREYLQSMVIFDMGNESFQNTSLPSPSRADGAVVYVPDLGSNGGGILVSLGGGTDTSQVSMSSLDIFDLSSLTWYKQSTNGPTPSQRVNPCAVLGSNSNSKNIYMYGGQNVLDPLPRTQYNDIWILSLPSFTWVQVGSMSGNPPGRSGHTCNAVGAQMVVVGGYVGADIPCDSPGIYVFDMTTLNWKSTFDIGTTYSAPAVVGGSSSGTATGGSSPTSTTSNTAASTKAGVASPTQGQAPLTSTDPNGNVISTLLTTQTIMTTMANGQTSMMTTTYAITATVTSTSPPKPSSSSGISVPKIAGIIGGALGAIILLLAAGWGLSTLLKRRKERRWSQSNGFSTVETVWPASDEAEDEMREYDVTHWDGTIFISPRQSLRVVNE